MPQSTRDLVKHWNDEAEKMRREAMFKRSKAYRTAFGPMRSHFFFQAKSLEAQADEAEASGWRLDLLWRGGEKRETPPVRPQSVAYTKPVREEDN